MLPVKSILKKELLEKMLPKRILLGTMIIIPIKFWNKRTLSISDSLPSCYGNSAVLNNQIKYLIRKTEDLVELGMNLKTGNLITFLKEHFDINTDFQSIKLNNHLLRRRLLS